MSELDTPTLDLSANVLSDDTPSKIIESDNGTDKWTTELLQKYGELRLPSLYDFILSQEKLAMEIRKQNKEIRSFSKSMDELKTDSWNVRGTVADVYDKVSEIKNFCDVIQESIDSDKELDNELDEDSELFSEDDEDEDDDIDGWFGEDLIEQQQLEEDSVEVLIHSMDTMLMLLNATEDFSNNLMTIVPSSNGMLFWQRSAWRTHFEEVVHGYHSGMKATRDKLLSLLADKKIELIHPAAGSSFDPQSHRAVEKVPGGRSQCIARVIRYGYRRNGEVLRFADVSVFL